MVTLHSARRGGEPVIEKLLTHEDILSSYEAVSKLYPCLPQLTSRLFVLAGVMAMEPNWSLGSGAVFLAERPI